MLSPDGRALVVLARPTGLASDLDFSKRVVADVERETDAERVPAAPSDR